MRNYGSLLVFLGAVCLAGCAMMTKNSYHSTGQYEPVMLEPIEMPVTPRQPMVRQREYYAIPDVVHENHERSQAAATASS